MNIILGDSVRLPLGSHTGSNFAPPPWVSGTATATFSVPPQPSTHEPAGVASAGSSPTRSDTQLFLQRVLGLNVQLSPPSPSALAD